METAKAVEGRAEVAAMVMEVVAMVKVVGVRVTEVAERAAGEGAAMAAAAARARAAVATGREVEAMAALMAKGVMVTEAAVVAAAVEVAAEKAAGVVVGMADLEAAEEREGGAGNRLSRPSRHGSTDHLCSIQQSRTP